MAIGNHKKVPTILRNYVHASMNIRTMVQYNLFAAAFSGYLNDAQARAMRCMVFSKQGEFGDVINQAIRSHQPVRPIHLAACVGADKFVENLLKLGANPNDLS